MDALVDSGATDCYGNLEFFADSATNSSDITIQKAPRMSIKLGDGKTFMHLDFIAFVDNMCTASGGHMFRYRSPACSCLPIAMRYALFDDTGCARNARAALEGRRSTVQSV